MPFFRSTSYSNYLTRHSIYKSKKFFAPLQVRTHKYVALLKQKKISGKRALSWVSFGERRNITGEKRGSLTLEAALCFPLVVFFCVILIMPMILMDRQRQIQAAVESVGEEISQYAYVSYLYKSGKGETLDVSGTNEREGSQLLEKVTAAYAVESVKRKISEQWVRDLSFYGTQITEDEMLQIIMKYKMPLPFSLFGQDSVDVETVCSRRLWTGADGERGKKKAETGEQDERMVYIGKSSTRYHLQSTCHYLFHNLTQIHSDDLVSIRNQDGKKYKPCSACKSSENAGPYYVLPYGTSYHSREDCRSLSAYVQEVPLRQVEYLGPCSYCAGGR